LFFEKRTRSSAEEGIAFVVFFSRVQHRSDSTASVSLCLEYCNYYGGGEERDSRGDETSVVAISLRSAAQLINRHEQKSVPSLMQSDCD
jgi:hypothetical protein